MKSKRIFVFYYLLFPFNIYGEGLVPEKTVKSLKSSLQDPLLIQLADQNHFQPPRAFQGWSGARDDVAWNGLSPLDNRVLSLTNKEKNSAVSVLRRISNAQNLLNLALLNTSGFVLSATRKPDKLFYGRDEPFLKSTKRVFSVSGAHYSSSYNHRVVKGFFPLKKHNKIVGIILAVWKEEELKNIKETPQILEKERKPILPSRPSEKPELDRFENIQPPSYETEESEADDEKDAELTK